MVLDCETTGLDPATDRVIEVGIRAFAFDRETGDLVGVDEGYAALEDPGIPLPEDVVKLTGITDDDVRGQVIDWDRVSALIEGADVVIAHNARFDRGFVDRRIGAPRKVWGCSQVLVDWWGHGFASAKLELLMVWHGFFVRSHRALEDSDALLHLLTHVPPEGERSYLAELLEAARQPVLRVEARQSPYDSREALKARGYRWEPSERYWWREIDVEDWDAEQVWLEREVYAGDFLGRTVRVSPFDRFKG